MKLSIKEVLGYLEENFKYADHADRVRLASLLNVKYTKALAEDAEEFQVDSSIDMLEEARAQMQMVRMLRKQILTQGVNANPKDLQALVSTTTSLFSVLTKYSNDIINQERIKAIENATLEAIGTLDEEVQKVFFQKLEELLNE